MLRWIKEKLSTRPLFLTSLQIISHLFPFFWPKKDFRRKFRVILVLLLAFATLALNLVVPIVFKDIVTVLSSHVTHSSTIIIVLILSYGLLWMLARFSEKMREMILFLPVCKTISDYSTHVFEHLHSLNYTFHLNKETGKITSAISQSQLAIAMVISNVLFRITPVILEILIAFVILWYLYGLSYGLYLLIILASYFVFTLLTENKSRTLQRNYSASELNVSSAITDSLLNSETVRYYNNQAIEYQKIAAFLKDTATANKALFGGIGLFQVLQTFIITAGLAVLSYKAGHQILIGQLKVGDFVLINGYLFLLFEPLNELSDIWRNTKNNLSKIEYSAYLLEQTDELEHDKQGAKPLMITGPHIRFNNVSFAYRPEHQILKKINFEITPNTMIGLVGSSGSGKSTIARLLLGLFDVASGNITIDHQDISTVTKKSLRQHIGIVPQDVLLFNNTLKFNLCYGTLNPSEQDINTAIHLAHLEEIISKLPKGLETNIGEDGFKLSGGERQRIGIARCLLRKPKILLFDEATASLDTKTEKNIQGNIEEVAKQTTSIVIAHRLSTIIHADHILVLHEGEVVETGTHRELLAKQGLYYAMWNSQQESSGHE